MEEVKEKKEPLKMPASTISIMIGPNSYETKTPTNGQFIDIISRKIKLTDSTHSQMLYGGGQEQQAYMLTEIAATLPVLFPQLLKDLNVPSILDLSPINPLTKQMVKAYTDIVFPWLTQIRTVANEDVDIK